MTIRAECTLIEDRLPRLLENDLPAGETLLVRAHLSDCPECAGALAEYESISLAITSSHSEPKLVEEAVARVRASIRLAIDSPPPPRRRLAIGLAAVALGAVGWLLGPPSGASLAAVRELPFLLARTTDPLARSLDLPGFLAPRDSDGDSRR